LVAAGKRNNPLEVQIERVARDIVAWEPLVSAGCFKTLPTHLVGEGIAGFFDGGWYCSA
jgi:hypothetical protein